MRNKRIRFTSLLFLFSLITLSTYAQNRHGFEGDFGLQVSDFDKASGYATFKYNHRLNPYMALNLGLNFVYSEINEAFDSPFEQRTFYDLSDDIVNMNFVRV